MGQPWHYNMNAKLQRAPIAVMQHATADYVLVTLVIGMDAVFSVCESSGYDLALAPAAGPFSSITYDSPSFGYATKSGSLRADYDGTAATRVECWWLYWQEAGASDGSGTLAATTTATVGYLTAAGPSGVMFTAAPTAPGQATPTQQFGKLSTESVMVWFEISTLLGGTDQTTWGRQTSERYLYYIDFDGTTGSGLYTGASTLAVAADRDGTRFFEEANRFWVGLKVDGGVSGTDYTLRLIGVTAEADTGANTFPFDVRVLCRVLDPTE